MPFIPNSPPFASQVRPKLPAAEFDRTQAALQTTTALAESLSAGKVDKGSLVFNAVDYGAVGDGRISTHGGISASSAILVISGSTSFLATDVGKPVQVNGAGAAGAPLVTTISSYTSSTTVTLAATASTTVSSAYVAWGTNNGPAILAAMAAATAAGRGRKVLLPPGAYSVVGGLSMSGQTCTLVGSGAHYDGGSNAAGSGTTIRAIAQTGPVLDFNGYGWPDYFRGHLTFGEFVVEGDNVADSTVTHHGINFGDGTLAHATGGARFHNIVIGKTGGIPLRMDTVYLSDFERITLLTPVGVVTNNVPYMWGTNVNANKFTRIGLRGLGGSADTAAKGAVIIEDGGGYPSYGNQFDSWWYEYLHCQTGGSFFCIRGNINTINDFSFSDCGPEVGSSNTAVFRFEKAAVDAGKGGGNILRGLVPGSAGAGYVTTGVVISQAGNYINGVKGYKGSNVTLLTGADNTTAILGGAYTTATDPAFINTGGITTASLVDYSTGYDNSPTAATLATTVTTLNALQKHDLNVTTYAAATGVAVGTDSNSDGLADGFTVVNYGTQVGDTYTTSVVGGAQRIVSAWSADNGNRRLKFQFPATSGRDYFVAVTIANASGITKVDAVCDIPGGNPSFTTNGATNISGSGTAYFRATAASTTTCSAQVGPYRTNSTTGQIDITGVQVVDLTSLIVDAPNVATMTNAQIAAFIAGLQSSPLSVASTQISDSTSVGRAVLTGASGTAIRTTIGAAAAVTSTDKPTAALYQTWDRRMPSSAITPTSGRLILSAIYLPAGTPVSSVSFASIAAITGGSHLWGALFSPSLALLGQSTDDTSATPWGAAAIKTFALSSAATTAVDGWHYIGFSYVGSSLTVAGITPGFAAMFASPAIGGLSTSSLTGTAPNPAGAPGASALLPWGYVS